MDNIFSMMDRRRQELDVKKRTSGWLLLACLTYFNLWNPRIIRKEFLQIPTYVEVITVSLTICFESKDSHLGR